MPIKKKRKKKDARVRVVWYKTIRVQHMRTDEARIIKFLCSRDQYRIHRRQRSVRLCNYVNGKEKVFPIPIHLRAEWVVARGGWVRQPQSTNKNWREEEEDKKNKRLNQTEAEIQIPGARSSIYNISSWYQP